MSQAFTQQQLTLKLLKIYIVQYLTTMHGFKNFQHEAINILALHLMAMIKKMALSIKRLISMQGITLPNCLHLVDFVHENKFVDFLSIIDYITKQSNNSNKNMQSFYSGLEGLSRSLFSEDTEQINQYKPQSLYPNIKYIPYVYISKAEQDPIPIRAPVVQGFKRPAQYTYRNAYEKVEKVDNNVQKLSNHSLRQMRRSLGILSIQQIQKQSEKKPRKLPNRNQQLNKNEILYDKLYLKRNINAF